MRRRQFITLLGSAASWPLAVRAQKASTIARIGLLTTGNPRSTPIFQAFEQRLRELGYDEGNNVAFEYRNAEGDPDRLPKLAGELVHLGVNLIVTATNPATRAAKEATTTVPILMVAVNYDPIALGYIASFARPGGNVTGLFFQHLGTTVKRFELFKDMLPNVGRISVFSDPLTVEQAEELQTANRSVGLKLELLELRNAPYDFENAFRVVMQSRAEALFVLESPSIFRGRAQIAALALKNRLPTSFAFRDYVEVGGLASYGVKFATMWRRAAEYADRILQGSKPADLPVEQASRFEFLINLKTATLLGLEIPPNVLTLADEVIE
jgi:putative tryptophan/tyrosine transport system substrate-binding protein